MSRLIDIIEDRKAYEQILFMILDALETKVLPNENTIPLLSDILGNNIVRSVFEEVTGKKYDE